MSTAIRKCNSDHLVFRHIYKMPCRIIRYFSFVRTLHWTTTSFAFIFQLVLVCHKLEKSQGSDIV